jgi:hypothetical protein
MLTIKEKLTERIPPALVGCGRLPDRPLFNEIGNSIVLWLCPTLCHTPTLLCVPQTRPTISAQVGLAYYCAREPQSAAVPEPTPFEHFCSYFFRFRRRAHSRRMMVRTRRCDVGFVYQSCGVQACMLWQPRWTTLVVYVWRSAGFRIRCQTSCQVYSRRHEP